MATLNINIDDTKIARWYAAYGVTTDLELKKAIKDRARQVVMAFEMAKASETTQATVKAAKDAQEATLEATIATIEAEIKAS